MNAEFRSAVIQIAAIRSVVDQGAMDAVQNAVIRFEARIVALNVAPIVVLNVVTPNAVVLSVVRNVVQDVARDVAFPCAASLYVRYAGDQCVVDLDAMVDFQDEVLPNDGRGVSPVDLLSLSAVQSAVSPVAALFSVRALSWSQVARCAAPQAYFPHRERYAVRFVHSRRHSAGCRDPDVHHAVDPATPAFPDVARSH